MNVWLYAPGFLIIELHGKITKLWEIDSEGAASIINILSI